MIQKEVTIIDQFCTDLDDGLAGLKDSSGVASLGNTGVDCGLCYGSFPVITAPIPCLLVDMLQVTI